MKARTDLIIGGFGNKENSGRLKNKKKFRWPGTIYIQDQIVFVLQENVVRGNEEKK